VQQQPFNVLFVLQRRASHDWFFVDLSFLNIFFQSNPGATPTAVTACSCLHHHHHHLHCHNHQTLLPHQPPPICTLCNSNVTNGPPTPSVINNQNNSATVGIQVDNPNVGVVRPQQGYLVFKFY